MLIYKGIFTAMESLLIMLTIAAVSHDKRKDQRTAMFKVVLWYVIICGVGCMVGMWI